MLHAEAEAPNLGLRISGQIMSFHRDYPDHKVVGLEIEEKEQTPGGYRYTVVKVKVEPRVQRG